jgi:hypothetical protein
VIRRRILCLSSVVLLAALAACAQTFDATNLGLEATMSSPVTAPAQGEAFRVTKKSVYFFAGLVSASKPSLENVLASQVTGDARVADLKIRVRSRWSDVLFTVLTAGLIVPRTVTYEGVIVGR